MSRPRDSQRSKVYAAEQATFGWGGDGRFGDKGLTIKECQAYINMVEASKWFQKHHGAGYRVTVYPGRNTGVSYGESVGYITLGKSARAHWVLLHELSHNINNSENGYDSVPGHGWQFAAIYLGLVRRFLGAEAHDALKAAFKARKVRFAEPKKRTVSPEQAAAGAARLAAHREKKAAEKAAAEDANPLKVKVAEKGNFRGADEVVVRVVNITDDNTEVFRSGSWGAKSAREKAAEKGAEFAKQFPGDLIETRVIGRWYFSLGRLNTRELVEYRFQPNEDARVLNVSPLRVV